MADSDRQAQLRAYLLGTPSRMTPAGRGLYTGPDLLTLVGERIYIGIDLPEGYRPLATDDDPAEDAGPAVLLQISVGGQQPGGPLRRLAITAHSYAATQELARQVRRALYARLQDASAPGYRRIWFTEGDRLETEPEPRFWLYVMDRYNALNA